METSHRHKDPAVQREFERLRNKSNVASTTAVAQVQGSGGASKPSGGTQQQTPLRVKYNTTTTVVPNTTVLDFIDTATITWSITRAGTTGEIRANADGILPDGSLDQTLRNTGDFPKDWVPSSRLMTRWDSAQASYSDVQGTVEAKGLSGDEVPTMYVKNINTSNDTGGYGQKSGTAIFAVSSAASGTASFSMTIDSINTANNGIAVHGTSNNGIGIKGVSDVGYGTFGISDSAPGAYGESNTGIGVYGISTANAGVYGRTTGGMIAINASNTSGTTGSTAVYAQSSGVSTYGVWAESANNTCISIYGTNAGGTAAIGVSGNTTGTDSIGVKGVSDGTDGFGVYGIANGADGFAGYFRSYGSGGVGVAGVNIGTGGIGGSFNGTVSGLTAESATGKAIDAFGGIYVDTSYYVNGVQVVTAQQAAVADATGTLASVTAQLNDLLAKLRTHGLIAT
jgi:hypothetical protein